MLAAGLQGVFDVAAIVPGAVSHRGVTYAERRGYRPLLLDLHVPAGLEGPVPCVVWIHGGGWENGDRRFTPSTWPDGWLYASLVEAGLAVATVDYRLAAECPFPAQLEDVLDAVRFLRANAPVLGIDPARFGVSGESAGGHLAALLALTGRQETAVQAAAVLYGVTDLEAMIASTPAERLQEAHESRLIHADLDPARLRAASPVHHASAAAPPMLLISGDSDHTVPLDQSLRLRDALVAAGAEDVVLEVVPGADHCFEGTDPVPSLETVVAFLADRLDG